MRTSQCSKNVKVQRGERFLRPRLAAPILMEILINHHHRLVLTFCQEDSLCLTSTRVKFGSVHKCVNVSLEIKIIIQAASHKIKPAVQTLFVPSSGTQRPCSIISTYSSFTILWQRQKQTSGVLIKGCVWRENTCYWSRVSVRPSFNNNAKCYLQFRNCFFLFLVTLLSSSRDVVLVFKICAW